VLVLIESTEEEGSFIAWQHFMQADISSPERLQLTASFPY
jgi:hypothetical protein